MKELRRRMISNTYKGPLQPPPTQNQPLHNRPNPQPQATQQAQAQLTSGASSDRGRVRGSAKARLGKRPAVSGDRRDNSRDTRPTTSQGPLDRQSITTRELAMIAHMRSYDGSQK